jgi:hypothetical protein
MKITELVLQTNKLEALEIFYGTVLNMKLSKEDDGRFEIITPGTKLIFTKTAEGRNPSYHFAFNIPSNKIQEARLWLKQKVDLLWMDDYQSDIADFVNWHAKSVYFIDPAGNIVELIARFDLNDMVEEEFSAKHIRNVSEIGLVFSAENFDAAIASFMQQYALNYFDKQPPLPQFRAIGDDEGLFIAVPENRVWFPTANVPAMSSPMKVKWTTDDALHYFEIN